MAQDYRYDPPIWGSTPPPQRGGQPNDSDDSPSWLVIVIMLCAFWPVGLFLLFRKLMGVTTTGSGSAYRGTYTADPVRRSQRRYTYTDAAASPRSAAAAAKGQQTNPRPTAPKSAARPTAPKSASPRPNTSHKALKRSAGRGFTIAGAVITWLFGMGLLAELSDALASTAGLLDALPGLVALGGFVGLGLVFLYVGIFRRRRSRLYLKYLGLIGRRERVSISSLCKAAGRSRKKVCAELQDMLDLGILPSGYLDLAGDQLVLSAQGLEDEKPQPEPQRQPPKADGDSDDDILRQIREINDAIPDPVMSAKIDRIGEITGRILDYQRKNPGKNAQLRSFLNYYLPTTLKILRSYAQLDQQGVDGENISAAKARIEGMMDKVVEGFEKQLDRLFQDDVMDISSDVAVLEQMLDQDGLGQSSTPFGGTT